MASAASYDTVVQDLYVAYFGRPADYFGLQNFAAALQAADPAGALTTLPALEAAYGTNAAVTALINSFGTSAESVGLYGVVNSATTALLFFAQRNSYNNLFNRNADVAGLNFRVNGIEKVCILTLR